MRAEIKKRVEQVRRGEVPEGYSKTKSLLHPDRWGSPVTLDTILCENKERNGDGRFGKKDVLSVSGENGVVNQINFMGRSYAGASVAPYHIVETGDIVYTKSPLKDNPYGIIKLNKGEAGIVSTLYAVYRCKEPVTGIYLDHYFSVNTFLNNYLKPLVKRGAKNDMKVNNGDALRGMIALPPLAEQQKIAEVLTHCDKVIDLKKQLLEAKRRQKKWLMQSLLNPDSKTLPFKAREQAIGEICIINQESLSGATKDDYSFYYVDIASVNSGKLTLPSEKVNFKKAPVRARRVVKEGDIIMSTVRPYLHAFAYINFVPKDIIVSTGFAVLTPYPEVCGSLLFQQLFSEKLNKQYSDMLVGTNYPALNTSDIAKLKVVLPVEFNDQQHLADLFSTADQEISLLEQELEVWQQKKKALMQLLLTGLVRV